MCIERFIASQKDNLPSLSLDFFFRWTEKQEHKAAEYRR